MRTHPACTALAVVTIVAASTLTAQRRFPPDSLINVRVFAQTTPVINVIGTMRNFAGWLGVRCQYCHIGEEGQPLETFDFASDDRRTKRTARVMMRMVEEINRRLTEIPERPAPQVAVDCGTCHRGVPRPVPLIDILTQALAAGGSDSATAAYRALRDRFHGHAAYDFGDGTLNTLAGRLTREGRLDEALRMVQLNAEFFPAASSVALAWGEVSLARHDTVRAIAEYRRAVGIDGNPQARRRLASLGSP